MRAEPRHAASEGLRHGIAENRGQFLHLLLQVLMVGLTIGLVRTVVPAMAESEFGVPAGSFMLLSAFVVAFGVVKAGLNFVAGRLSECLGRRNVLLLGWVAALPVPLLIYFAENWSWIVAATVLLGVNQGLTWSMTQTSKLDLARSDQLGTAISLNEFAGYIGVALAGVITAYAADTFGARLSLLLFGLSVVLLAMLFTLFWVKDTLPWAMAEARRREAPDGPGDPSGGQPRSGFRAGRSSVWCPGATVAWLPSARPGSWRSSSMPSSGSSIPSSSSARR